MFPFGNLFDVKMILAFRRNAFGNLALFLGRLVSARNTAGSGGDALGGLS